MDAEIITIPEYKLAGKRLTVNFAENRTPELWRGFMQVRDRIKSVGPEMFSAAVYPESFFDRFDSTANFEKWAAVAVDPSTDIPPDFDILTIPIGLYAVFHYKGSSADAAEVFGYIFNDWLPKSGYKLDNRPHFEILGEKYRTADPDSEEDIYIPIKNE